MHKFSTEPWDNSVKVSFLSPEELQKYRNGEHGGRKMVTYEDYLKLEAKGLKNKAIAKELGMSIATLYNRLKIWENKPLQEQVNEKTVEVPKVEVNQAEPVEKKSDLSEVIQELKLTIKKYENRVEQLTQTNDRIHQELLNSLSTNESLIQENNYLMRSNDQLIDEIRPLKQLVLAQLKREVEG